MKTFHISDILSITTGGLVSDRHMDGVYDILNFLTGDELLTHQLPRAMRECEPWLRTQFPAFFPDNAVMKVLLSGLAVSLELVESKEGREATCAHFVTSARIALRVPEHLPVYEMPEGEHTHIDALEEAGAIKGDDKVIMVVASEDA